MEDPVPYSIVVFVAPYEKLDERKKITKEIKRKATVVEAKKLHEHELKIWVRDKMNASKIEMSDQAIESIVRISRNQLNDAIPMNWIK